MKRIIAVILALASFTFIMTSCSSVQSPPANENSQPEEAQSCTPALKYNYYSSFEEMFQGLRDFTKEDLEFIEIHEDINEAQKTTRITEDERKNGIFGNFRKKLLEEETLLLPYYKGKEIPLFIHDQGQTSVTLAESGNYKKPSIDFMGAVENMWVSFFMQDYDKFLIGEANEKGAPWLISQMVPGAKLHNDAEEDGGTYYEKEYQLADRSVNAWVYDTSMVSERPRIAITFVYDDLLIEICSTPETIDKLLPNISFYEIHIPTHTQLRETPGRERTNQKEHFNSTDASVKQEFSFDPNLYSLVGAGDGGNRFYVKSMEDQERRARNHKLDGSEDDLGVILVCTVAGKSTNRIMQPPQNKWENKRTLRLAVLVYEKPCIA